MPQTPDSSPFGVLDALSQALLDASMESCFVMDAEGNVLAANAAAADLFDLPNADTLVQTNVYSLMPDKVLSLRRGHFQAAVKNAKTVRFDEELDDRSLVHTAVPLVEDDGSVNRIVVNTQDQTALKRSDEDLRREQQRQIFFMELLPGIVYHLYPDKSIRYANRYFRKYFGSPRGRRCHDALQCDGTTCNGCPPMEAMETDRAVEWDWTDSKGRTFHLQCSPMTDSSGQRMIMALGIDITARKRAEDALKIAHDKLEDRVRQRTRELQQANVELTSKSQRLVAAMKRADAATRAKSAFLANMSHEIRTPLNAILGMADLALRVEDGPQREGYLGRVLEAGDSLLSVINDILDFSKIEARKLTLEAIDFDLRKTVESAVEIQRIQMENKGLTTICRVDGRVPLALVGDPSRLRQVLINLVSNAVKFTDRGEVAVAATLVAGDDDPRPGEAVTLRFAVSDTGIGIPEDKRDAIFESFLQADDSVTRKHGGTGLGLAICKFLVELMGGELQVDSELGRGSEFSFTARFTVGDAAALTPDGDRTGDGAVWDMPKLSVLLAEDNHLNRELTTTLLEEQGHSVESVENGAQALERLKRDAFDLVLMDVQMPVMDGLTATRAIRDPNSGAVDTDVPIVVITAHALKGDRERFLAAGMNDYIAKPIKLEEFRQTIARTMHQQALDRPIADMTAAPQKAFNRDGALEMLGGRAELLTRMDAIFLRDVPGELDELNRHTAEREWEEARRLAHSIKSSARTVGALRAGAVAEQLEFYCRQKDGPLADREVKTLDAEVRSAIRYIDDNTPTDADDVRVRSEEQGL